MIDYKKFSSDWKAKIEGAIKHIHSVENDLGGFKYLLPSTTQHDGLNRIVFEKAELALIHSDAELLSLIPPLCEYLHVKGALNGGNLFYSFCDELFRANPATITLAEAVELCRKFEGILRAFSYIVFRGESFEFRNETFDAYAGGMHSSGIKVSSFYNFSLDALLTGQLSFYKKGKKIDGPILIVDGKAGLYQGNVNSDKSLLSNTLLYRLTEDVRQYRNLASHEGVTDEEIAKQLEGLGLPQYYNIHPLLIYNEVLLLLLAVLDYRYDLYEARALSDEGIYLPNEEECKTAEAKVAKGITLINRYYYEYLREYIEIEARNAFLGRAGEQQELINQLIEAQVREFRMGSYGRVELNDLQNPIDIVLSGHEDDRLCIFAGPSGAGKSTLLLQILWRKCLDAKNENPSKQSKIPVILALRQFADDNESLLDGLRSSFLSIIRPALREKEKEYVAMAYDELYANHRLLFLLDALDEVPAGVRSRTGVNIREKITQQIAKLAGIDVNGHSLVVTTRYSETKHEVDEVLSRANNAWSVYHMHPFTEEQKLQLLSNCQSIFQTSTIDWKELRIRIATNPTISNLANSPMHLMMLLAILTEEDDPAMIEHLRTGILYRHFTRLLYRKNSVRLDELNIRAEEIEDILVAIAERCWAKGKKKQTKDELIRFLTDKGHAASNRAVIEEVFAMAAGMNVLHCTPYDVEFAHAIFFYFYLSVFVVKRLHELSSDYNSFNAVISQLAEDESMIEMLRVVIELLFEEEGSNPSSPRLSRQLAEALLQIAPHKDEAAEVQPCGTMTVQGQMLSVSEVNFTFWGENTSLFLLCDICADLPLSTELDQESVYPTASDLVADILKLQLSIIAHEALSGRRWDQNHALLYQLFDNIAIFGKSEVLEILFKPEWLGLWLIEEEEVATVISDLTSKTRFEQLLQIKKEKKIRRKDYMARLQYLLASQYHRPKYLLDRLVTLESFLCKNAFIFSQDNLRKMYTYIFDSMSDIDRKLLYGRLQGNEFLRGQLIFFIEDAEFFMLHFEENLEHIDISPNMLKSFQMRIMGNTEWVTYFCRQCSAWADIVTSRMESGKIQKSHKNKMPAIAIHTWLIKGLRLSAILDFIYSHIEYLKKIDYLHRLLDLLDLRDIDPNVADQLYDSTVYHYSISQLRQDCPPEGIPYMLYDFQKREFAIPLISEPLLGKYIGLQYLQHNYVPEQWARVESIRQASVSLVRLQIDLAEESGKLPPMGQLEGLAADGTPVTISVYRISPYPTELPYYTYDTTGILQRWCSKKELLTFSGRPCYVVSAKSPQANATSIVSIIKLSGLSARGMLAQGFCQFYKGARTLLPLHIDKSISLPKSMAWKYFRPIVTTDADGMTNTIFYNVFDNNMANGNMLLLTQPFKLTPNLRICQLPCYRDQTQRSQGAVETCMKVVRTRRVEDYPRYLMLYTFNTEGIFIMRTHGNLTLRRTEKDKPEVIPYVFMSGRRRQFQFRITNRKWVDRFAHDTSLFDQLWSKGGLYIEDFPLQLQGMEIVEMDANLTLLEVKPLDSDILPLYEGAISFRDTKAVNKHVPVQLLQGANRVKKEITAIHVGAALSRSEVLIGNWINNAQDLWFRYADEISYHRIETSVPSRQIWKAKCMVEKETPLCGTIEIEGVDTTAYYRIVAIPSKESPQGDNHFLATIQVIFFDQNFDCQPDEILPALLSLRGIRKENNYHPLQICDPFVQVLDNSFVLCTLDHTLPYGIGEIVPKFKLFYYFPICSRIFDFLYQKFVLPQPDASTDAINSFVDVIDIDKSECYHHDTISMWISNMRATQTFNEQFIPMARVHSCMAEMLRYILTLPVEKRDLALQSPLLQIQPYVVSHLGSSSIALQSAMLEEGKHDINIYEYSPEQLRVGDLVIVEENRTVNLLPRRIRNRVLGYHNNCTVYRNSKGFLQASCPDFSNPILLDREEAEQLHLRPGQSISCLILYFSDRTPRGNYASDILVIEESEKN